MLLEVAWLLQVLDHPSQVLQLELPKGNLMQNQKIQLDSFNYLSARITIKSRVREKLQSLEALMQEWVVNQDLNSMVP